MYRMHSKLKLLEAHLKQWNKHTFGNIFTCKALLEQELMHLQQHIILEGRTEQDNQQELFLLSMIEEPTKQEETLWMQKYRIKWLKEGECNTTFFHHSTLQHRMHNRISQLKNYTGDLLETHQEMEQVLISYYDNLLSKEIMD